MDFTIDGLVFLCYKLGVQAGQDQFDTLAARSKKG